MNKEAFKQFVEASGLSYKDQNLVNGVVYDYLGSVAAYAMHHKVPSIEEIKSAGSHAMTKSHLSAKVFLFDGHSFELGWEQGAEWMEQQLEPLITDLSMEKARKGSQSAEVMTLEQCQQKVNSEYEIFIVSITTRERYAKAAELYASQFKAKADQLQDELTEYKAGLKQCQSDRYELQQQLDQVKADMEWISVKERLPEESDKVLGLMRDTFDQYICFYKKSRNLFIVYGAGADPISDMKVTHWMPLPSSEALQPKEGGSND